MKRALIGGTLLLAACGGPRVQQADVRAPIVPMMAGPAPIVALPTHDARWLVTPAHTRLEIHGWGPLVGEQVFTFRRFRANVSADRTTASFRAELDVASLEGGMPGMASLARDHMLEADSYPTAKFFGTARRQEGSDACEERGTLDLHGISRELVFDGRVHEEGDALRFQATFDMPRKAFDVRLHNAWDAFVPNDVRIVLDVRAEREHVFVEEVTDAP